MKITLNSDPIYSQVREPRWSREEIIAEIWQDGDTHHKVTLEYWKAEFDGVLEVEVKRPVLNFIPDSLSEDILQAIVLNENPRKINLTIV